MKPITRRQLLDARDRLGDRAGGHVLLVRDQSVRDWRIDGACSCGGWEFLNAWDFPALRRAFAKHCPESAT